MGCPVLVIDAAYPTFFVGLLAAPGGQPKWLKTVTTEAGAVEQLFPALQTALTATGLSLQALRGIVICEGPGNLLGLRTAVIAAETWRAIGINPDRQLWSYRSLDFIQYCVGTDFPELKDADVLMDWRRGHWFRCRLRNGQWLDADTLAAADLDAANLAADVFFIQGRGNWPAPTLPTRRLSYDALRLVGWIANSAAQIHSVQQFEIRGEPIKEYVRWSGKRHLKR